MLRTRIIPVLLIEQERIVKTIKFSNPTYIGDPTNTIRIFNELEVDELMLLDINASLKNKKPNFKLLNNLASECFMPLSYGGGINDMETAKKIFKIGFEKISINSVTFSNPQFVEKLSSYFGSQAIIGSIDIKYEKDNYSTYSFSGKKNEHLSPLIKAKNLEDMGVGELLITSIDREGTWEGYDLQVLEEIANAVSIPVIANGGAGKLEDIKKVINSGNISAVGLGSMVVYQKKNCGVLINMPNQNQFMHIK